MNTIPADKMDLLPDIYQIRGDSLCLVQVDKDGSKKYQPLANFFAWIQKDVIKDDGAEKTRFYEVEGVILTSYKSLPPILVPAGEFDGMKWISKSWGPEPSIQPGIYMKDTMRHAIQTTATGVARENIFAHLGFVKLDDKWVYLHANGAIGRLSVKVELDPRLKGYALPESPGDATSAMQTSLKLLEVAPMHVTLVLWSLVYLSVMCEWLRPKFLVWLHGYTGSRKTTLAMLFLGHFGNLTERPPASFKDTANSVEKRCFDAKDSLLLIDDYHPTSSSKEAKAMAQLAQQILRAYGDLVGRGRMRQDTSLRPDYPPRGIAIVTAEDLIDGGSSVARHFPVELKQDDVDLDRLTDAQVNTRALSQAMAGYIAWVAEAMNAGYDGQLKALFAKKRDELAYLGIHGRLVEAASWLYVGLYSGLEYACSISAIEPTRKEMLLGLAWELFTGIVSEQGDQVSEIKATVHFLNIVAELLSNGTIYTDPVKPDQFYVPKDKGTKVGWHDPSYFYFLPNVLYNTISRFLISQDSRFEITEQVLWKQLADEGVTVTDSSKEGGRNRMHYTRKKEIDGTRTRMLWVKFDVLKSKVEQSSKPHIRTRPRANPHPHSQMNLDY